MTGRDLPPLSCCDYLVWGLLRREPPQRVTEPPVFSEATQCLQRPNPSAPCPYLLKIANGGRAAGRVLAHAHGGVVLIQLTHFAMFAVVVLAGVW